MQKKKITSNIILFLFFILVAAAVTFSDIFQAPLKKNSDLTGQEKLFVASDLNLIKTILLKNKSGEFIFERSATNRPYSWHMISPRNISVNSLFIEKLFNALTTIKVKKIFPYEQTNISNFSLDRPTSTLNLTDQSGNVITIIFGLINTIDNSTYLKISGKNGIFHVEAPGVSLEDASILSLTESQFFSFDAENVSSISLFRGNKKTTTPQLQITKKGGKWYDPAGNVLLPEKVTDFFQEFSRLKSSFIVDMQTESQKKQFYNLTRNAAYILSIQDIKGNIIDYNISGLIKSLNDLDLKNEEYFIINNPTDTTSYIVKKDFYEIFTHKSDLLK